MAEEKIEINEAPMMDAPEAPVAASADKPVVEEKKEEKKPAEKPLRWYVVQAFSGFEQRVAQTLRERIKIHNMEHDFGEVLVPKEKVKEIKDGKKRESERKFFPGYVLVQMRMTSETWQLVKHTDRVLGFIGGTAEKPLPITQAEADKIFGNPLAWPDPEIVAFASAIGYDAGNVNATGIGDVHYLAYYSGDSKNTSVVVSAAKAPVKKSE